MQQKCCLHCPGRWTSSFKERRDEHSCCLPTYVRGNLKLSSLRKSCDDDAGRSETLRGKASAKPPPERPSSCYDRFAIAKKFHSENLQHQPLPDRVDDSIFKNSRPADGRQNARSRTRPSSGPHDQAIRRDATRFRQKVRAGVQYGPTLGCKTPTTNMDLAICWEAPLDRSYEPPRAVHIDGTDGGPAPAIFALVEHEVPQRGAENLTDPCKCFKSAVEVYEAKFSNVRNLCRCPAANKSRARQSPVARAGDELPKGPASERCWQCPDDLEAANKPDEDGDLCDELDSFHISEEANGDGASGERGIDGRSKKVQPLHLRNCSSCECRGERSARKHRGQRLVKSAYGGTRNARRNGLPTKISVPRPKTPYAKRSFCIDTLTPPFSIINGCRDADYPEHWRLTSVYQQSYRNPRRQRATILNYD